ncbi:MAG: RIP metalloprotease RseP, partial [Pseudomonadota bacterium]
LAGTIASFLVVLGVVVFVHEYGHYIVARWCGIHAEVFSIGFGKELAGWNDRRGTRWRVAALPLGGYVKFLGDADAASAGADSEKLQGLSADQRAHAFPNAALWKRALAVSAGPAFNFLLAIVVYAGLALSLGVGSDKPVVGVVDATAGPAFELREGDRVLAVQGREIESFGDILPAFEAASDAEPGRARFELRIERGGAEQVVETGPAVPPVIGGVGPDSPAERAGLKAGERIVSADGESVRSFSDLQRVVIDAGGEAVTLIVEGGDGTRREVTLTPQMNPVPTSGGGIEMRPLIGVTAQPLIGAETVTPGPIEAVGVGVQRTWQVIASSLAYVGAIVTGEADSSGLGGPIKIASLSGEAAAGGLVSFLGMIAMISTSIGLINLFPIPVLDGGHLVFYAIEAVRGRPLGEKAAEAATGVGLALVLLLMVFVTYNDIMGL